MTIEANILIIEDELQIRRCVKIALEAEGCRVFEATTGERGLIEAGCRNPDLVIIDLGLPDMDGIQVVQDFRRWSGVPILVLSARIGERDKVHALDSGADDYLTKPFGIGELLARIRALIRRRQSGIDPTPKVCFNDVEIDFSRRTIMRAGQAVHLTPLEYRLLGLLVANSGKIMTHRLLMNKVWGPGHTHSSHYLRIYISHLRQKLEADPAQPRHFLTETGVGYRFEP